MSGQEKTDNGLLLCIGNPARSIIAEAVSNRLGAGRFTLYSAAGGHPAAVLGFDAETANGGMRQRQETP